MRADYLADCRVYDGRVRANRVLREDVPQMQAQLAAIVEAESESLAKLDAAQKQLAAIAADNPTMAGLSEDAVSARERAVTDSRRKRVDLEGAIRTRTAQAVDELTRTASPAVIEQVKGLTSSRISLEQRRQGRREILAAPAALAKQQALCESLAVAEPRGETPDSLRKRYNAGLARLAELRELAAHYDAETKRDAADAEKLTAMDAEIAAARERMYEPSAMNWELPTNTNWL
jgi:hypothetical protein